MSNTYNSTLQSNNIDLQEVLQTLQTKAAGGAQATPVISVNSSNGLITATAGTKSSTHQLAFQAAKTITPSTASQIAVSSGYYTGGNITVAAVPTQTKTVTPTSSVQNVTPDSGKFLSGVAVNAIPSDYIVPSGTKTVTTNGTHDVKSFASVTVSVAGSGGNTDAEDGLVSRTLTSYTNDRVTTIDDYVFNRYFKLITVSFPRATSIGEAAFCYCSSLATVSFPNVTTINGSAFYSCYKLTTASFPNAITINSSAFGYCSSLATVSFPKATTLSMYAFHYCSALTTASFPNASIIYMAAFSRCYNLKSLYLTGSSLCKLSASTAFSSTPIGGYSTKAGTYGSIYVPASLLTSYQTATNWTYFSSRFVGI